MRYLLNEAIEFDPVAETLTARNKSPIVMSLNAPVSRCLQLLIEERHNTVAQQAFYPYVWGDSGNTVSVNTLYQNIALLRKALKMFDEQGNQYVMTVPKQGFALSPQVSITELTEEQAPHAAIPVPEPDEEVPEETAGTDFPAPAIPVREKQQAHAALPIVKKAFLPTLTTLLFVVMSVQLILWGFPHVALSKVTYKQMPSVSGCTILTGNVAVSPGFVEKMVNNKLINCRQEPWLYLLSSQENNHITMLACQASLESSSPSACRSLSLWGKTP